MTGDLFGRIETLMTQLQSSVIDECRRELSRHKDGHPHLENFEKAMQLVWDAPAGSEKANAPDSFREIFLKELAVRASARLMADDQIKNISSIGRCMESRLQDYRTAGILAAVAAGNAGVPWAGVDLSRPDRQGCSFVRAGRWVLNAEDVKRGLPAVDWNISLPAVIDIKRSAVISCVEPERFKATGVLQSMALRILLTFPAGSVKVSLIDPSASWMPVWSSWPGVLCKTEFEIEQRLTECSALAARYSGGSVCGQRSEGQGGKPAAPLQVLVINDVPGGLPRHILQKLYNLIQTGPRSGILPLVVSGERSELSVSPLFRDEKNTIFFLQGDSSGYFRVNMHLYRDFLLEPDDVPPVPMAEHIINAAKKSWEVSDAESARFDLTLTDCGAGTDATGSSLNGLRAPLGKTMEGAPVCLELMEGKGLHALIIGGSGSGKSNLLHVIILSLISVYSPDELQLYLIDMKGVEFKPYAIRRLPHAAVIAVNSDRDFAVSVLESLCSEMERRRELFKLNGDGVNDIRRYRATGGNLPRILLVIDEFQFLFSGRDELSERSRQMLDLILKQGRAFGIHALFGLQSLQGVSMPGGALEQVNVRIVLRCDPQDSILALGIHNTAGAELPPGYYGIYNDQQGRKSANVQFRLTHLEDKSAHLDRVAVQSDKYKCPSAVFDGDEAPGIEKCPEYLRIKNRQESCLSTGPTWVWLGEPLAIQPAVRIEFCSRRGKNLLAVMQKEKDGRAILCNSLLSLMAQNQSREGRFIFFDLSVPDRKDRMAEFCQLSGGQVDMVKDSVSVLNSLRTLAAELDMRIKAGWSLKPPVFVFIFGIQYFRDFWTKDSYGTRGSDTPAGIFSRLVKEGAEHGIHFIVWCNMAGSFSRLGRDLLDEFGIRVTTRISRKDSMDVLGCDAAAALRDDVPRAVLLDDENPGICRIFRPYVFPDFSSCESTGCVSAEQGEK